MIFVRNMACFKRNSSNCCESKCEDRHGLKIFEMKIQLKVHNNEFALFAVFMQLYILKRNTLPVPGRPTIWITVGQGPTALAVGAGGCCLDIFTLICSFSPLSPSLWETARYELKYCLKGPLNPKQPTNQPTCISAVMILVPTIHVFACPHILGKLPLAPFDRFS